MIRKTHAILWVGVGGIAILLLFLGYSVIDQAVTIDHLSQELRITQRDLAVLQQVANDSLHSSSETELRSRLRTKYGASHLLKENTPGFVSVDGVGLRFEENRLVEFVRRSQ